MEREARPTRSEPGDKRHIRRCLSTSRNSNCHSELRIRGELFRTKLPKIGISVVMPYKAFISYSHAADSKLASALQSALYQFAKPGTGFVQSIFCSKRKPKRMKEELLNNSSAFNNLTIA